jgi:AraC family transcriptional regulator
MLTSSRADIGYVANAHGYATSQAYSKAFRRAFGMPPSAYRKSPVELKICDPFNIELVRSCKGGVLILPDIKLMPAFSLAGIRHKIRAKDNIYRAVGMRHAIDFFFTESKSIRKPVSRGKYFGLGLSPEYFTEITEDEQYVFYMPSLLVDENSVIPDGMVRAYLPARKYAQFKYTGMHNVLDTGGDVFYDIWDYILFKWLPTVRYKEDGHCCFEYIDTARCSDDYCEIDFYLSICE